ncbi:MAG TPA: glycosyltransferase family 2 protein [Thermoplasmata archaeon]|nr:glycosyltransferase family 2 protein [Thermoplasmata archaeon]
MTEAFISVIIPAFDRREFLEGAVASVLAQSLPRSDYEMVVIKNFAHPAVDARRDEPGTKILWDDSPAIGAMLARAIDACEGEIVCFLDDDDQFEPDKLCRIARLFREDPRRTFVHDAIAPMDRRGHSLPDWGRFRTQPTVSYSVTNASERRARTPDFFRNGVSVNLSAMSVRTSLLRAVADRFRQVDASPDIFVFFAALASEGTLWIEAHRLTRYRFHSSASHAEIDEGGWASEAQRLAREERTVELVEEMTQGKPAETAGRGYVAEARFQFYLTVPGAPPPSWGQFAELLRAARVRRQAYLASRALWALAKRMAPQWTTRAYHRHSHARHAPVRAP